MHRLAQNVSARRLKTPCKLMDAGRFHGAAHQTSQSRFPIERYCLVRAHQWRKLCNPDLWHKTMQEPAPLQWKTMHPHLEGFNLSSSLFKTAQASRMNTNALCVSHKTANRRIKRFICARVRESTDPVSVRESGKMAVKEKGNYLHLPNHQVRHLSLVPVSYGFSVWHWKLFGSI